MAKVDQRRFDNQQSEFLSAREASRRLGVKLRTLYAYASRGLVRSVPSGKGRARLYARAEIEQLKAKSAARSGHGPVAAGALRWGEPVLESAITAIAADGPRYRGRAASELADLPFEVVAELLWTGTLPSHAPAWRVRSLGIRPVGGCASPLAALTLAAAALGVGDDARFATLPEAEHERARALVRRMVAALSERPAASLAARSVAESLLVALGGSCKPAAVEAVNATLVACADHELNASTFAARVAASTGADLYACVTAALATLSGPLHGAASDRVAALIDEIDSPRRARRMLSERMRRGEELTGFGHPLYPQGDPRGARLLDVARRVGARGSETVLAAVSAMRALTGLEPTLDVGLVAVVHALGLPRGSGAVLFAVGRTAGWVAHVIEQRSAGHILRPRARYVGP